ncbi:Transcription regulator HTH, APSES-type DNA-binding domain [Ceraceosorus bombacis]|uniref:Transcription regulator HTH, APSES-type DNA-binding domain n=1 Tax=Ceraceosorus bombacis TaxID=401625 RepID=A0A0P1BQ18_9BASI|nr:Transcription regulator HTH, APSES-type DNA-binding domain [Ceraceosorus bombacis]
MPSGSRRTTPRRARSSSVASNASAGSTRSARSSSKTAKSPSKGRASVKSSTSASAANNHEELERPALPVKRNPVLPSEDVPVKLQVIRRDGKNIIIGRVKLPTVNGSDHAFLLKRFDTNAVAASSMFRLAFPWATGAEERAEMAYLESRFDAERANGGEPREPVATPKRKPGRPKKQSEEEAETESHGTGSTGVRLQGIWIPSADALEVAEEYGLEQFAKPLIEARAEHSDAGPLLTPSKNDTVSTPSTARTKRARTKVEETETASVTADGSPAIIRTRTVTAPNGDVKSESTTTPLTDAQIAADIKQAKALAAEAQASVSSRGGSKKRRALDQNASADIDHLADDEDYQSNVIVRSVRRGAGVVRHRPLATSAGAIGTVSALGVGALAWMSGGNVDVATQIIQQGIANLGNWF